MKWTLHTASILEKLNLCFDKRNNSFTSGRRHAPKVTKMNPEIQVYAKQ